MLIKLTHNMRANFKISVEMIRLIRLKQNTLNSKHDEKGHRVPI